MFLQNVHTKGRSASINFATTAFVFDLSLVHSCCEDWKSKIFQELVFHDSIDSSIWNLFMLSLYMVSQLFIEFVLSVTGSTSKESSWNVLFISSIVKFSFFGVFSFGYYFLSYFAFFYIGNVWFFCSRSQYVHQTQFFFGKFNLIFDISLGFL